MRVVGLFLLLVMIGLTGCRRAPTSAASDKAVVAANADDCATSTGPLSQQAAEREALKAVSKEAGRDHTCSVASVRDHSDVYEVCVRIDPSPSEQKRLPEHWTVEIPKVGVTQNPNPGGG
jgi:hypothetical protein